jgi:hypothetical protein
VQQWLRMRKPVGKPEASVERHLVKETQARGGRAVKLVDKGRRGCPDRRLFLRGTSREIWIETKAIDGKLESWQERYHEELRSYGYVVLVLWTISQIDKFFADYDRGVYG